MGPDHLFLLGPLGAVQWQLTFRQGTTEATEAGRGLESLQTRLGGLTPARIDWALGPSQALRLNLAVPGKRAGAQRRAAPFLLEEYLTEPLETLHVALAERGDGGTLGILALGQAPFADDLAQLEALGLAPDGVYALCDTLPDQSQPVLWLTGEAEGLWLDPREGRQLALTPALLTGLGDALGTGATLTVIGPSPELPLTWQAALEGQGYDALSYHPGTLPALSPRAPGPRAPAALQGPFTPRVRPREGLGPWRAPSRLAAALAIVLLGGTLGEGLWLQHQAQAQRAALEARFATLWPERAGRSPNPRRELSLLLGGDGGSGAGLLPTLDALAGAMSNEHRINQLRYQGDRGTLAVELTTASLSTLQALQQRLQSEGGLGVSMENATQDQSGVRARLTLQGRP
jgi:general secretion pathway protein L